jgi:predicted AAA+ superfamily ATPase
MDAVRRVLEETVRQAMRAFPAVVLTGPRRAGKTTLLREMLPDASYVLLEDPDIQSRIKVDARSLLEALKPPVILDEIQNAPQLFNYVRTIIDQNPRRMGQWFFTGSQELPLMKGVTESMAGRAAILELLPMSIAESPKVDVFLGGYPEVLARPRDRELRLNSYLQTYLERDVRLITNVRDLPTFRTFLTLLATRHGQVLNRSDLAAPLGVSVPTIEQWLRILEATNQILRVPPYFENVGKRLIKAPKVYWLDSGMACYLLSVPSVADLDKSPFLGPLYEGFIAGEICKWQVNRGRRKELYYFRDRVGLEVDFVMPGPNGEVWLIEAKATRTPVPRMAEPMDIVRRALAKRDRPVRAMLVHRKSKTVVKTTAIMPGIEARTTEEFIDLLSGQRAGML